MYSETLFENKTAFKIIFIVELIIGALLPSLFFYLFKNDMYIGLFTIASPLLGLALINTALRDSKIKKISVNETTNCVEIEKESLFGISVREINLLNFKTQLKSDYKPEDYQFISLTKKIKLIIFDGDKAIEIMESGFLSRNNKEIMKLYNKLKAIIKTGGK